MKKNRPIVINFLISFTKENKREGRKTRGKAGEGRIVGKLESLFTRENEGITAKGIF